MPEGNESIRGQMSNRLVGLAHATVLLVQLLDNAVSNLKKMNANLFSKGSSLREDGTRMSTATATVRSSGFSLNSFSLKVPFYCQGNT